MDQISGIPVGMELVRIGQAGDDEYELVRAVDGTVTMFRGPRGFSQVVVQPAHGYAMHYNPLTNGYQPVRELPAPVRVVVEFAARTQEQVDFLHHLGDLSEVKAMELTPTVEANPDKAGA
jgi:hypothetical protein